MVIASPVPDMEGQDSTLKNLGFRFTPDAPRRRSSERFPLLSPRRGYTTWQA